MSLAVAHDIAPAELAALEARLEAAVEANPHCTPNVFLRRRALVVAHGASGGPEVFVILRSSIWPSRPFGPVVGHCAPNTNAEETQFETRFFALANMAEGPTRTLAFRQLYEQIAEPTTVALSFAAEMANVSSFEDAVSNLCSQIADFSTKALELELQRTLEGRAYAD